MSKVTAPPQQSTPTTQTVSQHAASRTDFDQEHPSPWSRTTQEPQPRRTLPDLASVGIQRSVQPELRSLNHRGATTLPNATQRQMSHTFGHSFNDVRIQRNSPIAQGPVQAVTQGRTIHFAPGRFQPGTPRGDWLIGHELAHVVQQSTQPATASTAAQEFRPDASGYATDQSALEGEADRAASDAVAGRPARVVLRVPYGQSQAFSGSTPGAKEPAGGQESGPEQGGPTAAKSLVPAGAEKVEETTGAEQPQSVQSQSAQEDGAASAGGTGQEQGQAGGGGDAELLMPEPPNALSEAAQGRLSGIAGQVDAAAQAVTALPTSAAVTEDARGAVDEPEAEQDAMAEAAAVEQVDDRPAPSASIEEACRRIKSIIKAKRPPDEDSLVEAKPKEMAEQAGGQVNSDVESRAGSVRGGYEEIAEPADGQPSRDAVPATPLAGQAETSAIDAETGAPDELRQEDVSLDNDVANQQQAIAHAGMETEPAKLVQSGPIAEAREGLEGLQETAQTGPEQVMAEQAAAIDSARNEMRALQEAASASLTEARSGAVGNINRMSVDTTASEERQRAQAGAAMQSIFASAQKRVDDLLTPISANAIQRWDAGVAQLSQQFEDSLAIVKRKVDERYAVDTSSVGSAIGSGLRAAGNWLGDTFTGLPPEIVDAYDRAEEQFANGCCDLARDISRDVNQIIDTCEQIIEQARKDIDSYIDSLPGNLRDWASGQADQINQQLDDLQNRVSAAQEGLNNDLVNRANQAVQEVRERVHTLREEAKGLIGGILDSINKFLDDPARFIIEGLLKLVGIEPARFWAMIDKLGQVIDGIAADPMGFANNLMDALGQGFQQFFDRFPEHLLQGLLDWLFSKLGETGVRMPKDFSLSSIITLFLEMMGITWPRIRTLIGKHIGEENLELIEKAVELVSTLMEQGPEGIFEMIKEQFDPQTILDSVIEAVKDYVMEALITKVTARILAMFNPAGAIIQAIEAIYRVLKWIFENAAKIFTLVETVVNGAAEILAGNTSGLANAIESALAGLIAPVIGFLADYIGLGGIPEAIKTAVLGLQQRVEQILDRVIGFLADRAKGLLKAMGIGGKEGDDTAATISITEPFKDEAKEDHTAELRTVGKGKNKKMEILVRSDERNLETLIDILSATDKDKADQLKKEYEEISKDMASSSQETQKSQGHEYYKQRLQSIVDILADVVIPEESERTLVSYTMSSGRASVVTADPLTKNVGNTKPSKATTQLAVPSDVKDLIAKKSGGASQLTGVHMLAGPGQFNLHGPNEAWNLAGGNHQMNVQMFDPERESNEKIHQNNLSVRYKVEAFYGESAKPSQETIEQAKEDLANQKLDTALKAVKFYVAEKLRVTVGDQEGEKVYEANSGIGEDFLADVVPVPLHERIEAAMGSNAKGQPINRQIVRDAGIHADNNKIDEAFQTLETDGKIIQEVPGGVRYWNV